MTKALQKKWYTDTAVGIRVTGVPTYGQWEDHMTPLLVARERLPLFIGDMLLYGEARWPDKYAQVLEGYAKQTLDNYASTCRRVLLATREMFSELKYRHFHAVASLEHVVQIELLKKAQTQGMTSEELRVLARIERGREPIARMKGTGWLEKELREDGEHLDIKPGLQEGDIERGSIEFNIKNV